MAEKNTRPSKTSPSYLRFMRRHPLITGMNALIAAGFLASKIHKYHLSKKPMVLELDLTKQISDSHPNTLRWDQWGQPLLRDVIDAIEYAATDPKVHGIVAHVGEAANEIATIQEIRDQIKVFSSAWSPITTNENEIQPSPKKKFSIAIADSFGLLGGGLPSYYLASAFDQIVVQPSGYVAISGLSAEPMFFRGLLNKLGIVPRFFKREEYKNYPNMFTETGLTPPHREFLESFLDDLNSQIVSGIAESRHLSEQDVRSLIKSAPHTATDAKRLGLVDTLGFPYFVHMMKEKHFNEPLRKDFFPCLPSNLRVVKIEDYINDVKRQQVRRSFSSKSKAALIYATGHISEMRGEHYGMIDAMQVTEQILKATADPQVKAIVVRVDSPGGSALASDMIHDALWQARQNGKLVVASMGNCAASGGYYVAMAANKIVAQPGTITGSIGVLMGKFVLTQFFDKVGINVDGIYPDKGSRWMSFVQDWDKEDQKEINGMIGADYENFLEKASISRNLSREHIAKYAQGRVWTGLQAMDAKLIDEFGGLNRAIALATKLAQERDKQIKSLRVVLFPEKETWLQKIVKIWENPTFIMEKAGQSARAIQHISGTLAQVSRVMNPFLKGMDSPHVEMSFRMDKPWDRNDAKSK